MREEIRKACEDFDIRVPSEIYKLHSKLTVHYWANIDNNRASWIHRGEPYGIAFAGLEKRDGIPRNGLSCYCLSSKNGPLMFVYCDETTRDEIRECLFRTTGAMGYQENPFAEVERFEARYTDEIDSGEYATVSGTRNANNDTIVVNNEEVRIGTIPRSFWDSAVEDIRRALSGTQEER